MKAKLILTLFAIVSFNFGIFAQGITNDGATIVITSGTTVSVTNGGGYINLTNGANHGQIDLDGTLQIEGDFVNEATSVTENVFINTNTDGTVVFTGTADQHIKNTTANAFIDFENLTVNKASNTVFVDAGSAATVNGNLTVTSGTFRLSSPTDGEDPSGSLITVGNVSGAGNIYVDRHFETGNRWQYVSMPVNNATDDMFDQGSAGDYNPNFFTYNEAVEGGDPPAASYSYWTDYVNYTFYTAWEHAAVDGTTVTLDAAKGYITYNDQELDVAFGGATSNLNNNANYTPSISYTNNDGGNGAGDYYDGWNIIGNPYPCALDFNALGLTNVNNTVYYWDGDNDNYRYYNNGGGQTDDGSDVVSGGSRYIPAMQSFAIKTNNGGVPSISIAKAHRVHNTQTMWKKGDNAETLTQYLKLRTEANGFSDETVVRFLEDAVVDIDNQYDAFKMFPNNQDVPMIYSLTTETVEYPLAINSLPLTSIGTTIPLGFKTGEAGTFTIQVTEFNFDAGTEVKLIDTQENKETTLYEGAEYTFTFDGEDSRDRFFLFSATSGIENPDADTDLETKIKIWSSNKDVFVSINSYNLIDANIQVFDILGKNIIDKKLNGTYNIINVPAVSGTYFVKIRTKDGKVKTEKVFIR